MIDWRHISSQSKGKYIYNAQINTLLIKCEHKGRYYIHILLNGFCYRPDRKLWNGKEFWCCTQDACKGRINVHQSLWEDVIANTHVPQPPESAMKKMVSNPRERATVSNDVPRRIIQDTQILLYIAYIFSFYSGCLCVFNLSFIFL